MGSDRIAEIAQRIGIPPELASGALAQLLPHVIDSATPNGEVPEHSQLEEGLSLLKARLLGG